jgi:leucyl-tRNA synthetase
MYDHKTIDAKWQARWDELQAFRAADPAETEKDPYYCLIEFPFPSGAGLHVGHPRSFTALDVIARKRRMEGYNVLYPIGWDAFGLPTENFAIKTGRAPKQVTAENIATFKRQLKSLGLSFDWSREVNTSDPAYYKWTQWMFLQFFKAGLAYKEKMQVNWCPSCRIGLANEEVIQGNCERCGNPAGKKEKEQWMIAITKYADRLIEDLKTVDYPERVVKQQIDWIGRSEGAQIVFKAGNHAIEVYTTRPDTIYGATYLVLAPEHELVEALTAPEVQEEVQAYIRNAASKSDIERQEGAKQEKTGVFTGSYAEHPLTGERIPIWTADYVLGNYGTGAIMAVPAHDDRDFAFAKAFDLPIIPVIARRAPGFVEAEHVKAAKALILKDGKICVEKFRDADFWSLPGGRLEEGETVMDALQREVAEETGYQVVSAELIGVVQDHIAFPDLDLEKRSLEFHVHIVEVAQETVEPRAIDVERSEWHWLSFEEAAKKLEGSSSPLMAAIIRDFAAGTVFSGSGVSIASQEFSGKETSEMKDVIIAELETRNLGERKVNYRLRDWLFSRQRYWGEPIPLVKCERGCAPETDGWVPIEESSLPLELPVVERYQPTDTGESPLASVDDWVQTECPSCGAPARRETDTMPNWAGSSWYFLRYTDALNMNAFASKEALDYWMQVDWYNGGMEHATLHLLYSRFWHKFLFDQGLVPHAEPYARRTSHGLILAEDGSKMSKSKGNVVNPDEIVERHGADTLRVYELFMGPFSEPVPWSENGVIGVRRFLDKVAKLPELLVDADSDALLRAYHKLIQFVTDAIEDMRFNSAIAELMSFVNLAKKEKGISKETLLGFLQLLFVFTPHLASDMNESLGGVERLDLLAWPKANPDLLIDDTVMIAIQVNGKLRGQIEMPADASEADILAAAKAEPGAKKYLTSDIKKEVYISGRLVNFVL